MTSTSVEQLPELPRLHPADMQMGASPRVMRAEIEAIFIDAARNAPRSRQQAIGPSELGTPCLRKLGYRLAEAPTHNETDPWRPTVGTAAHAWIADALLMWNQNNHDRLGFSRYLVEMQVAVGVVGNQLITGSADCYDRVTSEVIDWKVVGTTTLKAVKQANRRSGAPDGIGPISKPGYRIQAHLYGRGFSLRGLPVHAVNIAYLPSSGELRDAVWQREEYDETVALQAIQRANALTDAMNMVGAEGILPSLPRTDDLCSYCAYWNPGADETYVYDGCRGADGDGSAGAPAYRRGGPPSNETLVSQLIGS